MAAEFPRQRVSEKSEEVAELYMADPCATCGKARSGYADMRRRKMRVELPPECFDRARCDGETEAALRAEIAYLMAPKPPREAAA